MPRCGVASAGNQAQTGEIPCRYRGPRSLHSLHKCQDTSVSAPWSLRPSGLPIGSEPPEMPKDYTVVRKAAVELAGSGEATLAEIARLAGTSRQLVRFWLRDIDVPNRRQAIYKNSGVNTSRHSGRVNRVLP